MEPAVQDIILQATSNEAKWGQECTPLMLAVLAEKVSGVSGALFDLFRDEAMGISIHRLAMQVSAAGNAARKLLANPDDAERNNSEYDLRAELVQTAAACLTWIRDLDRAAQDAGEDAIHNHGHGHDHRHNDHDPDGVHHHAHGPALQDYARHIESHRMVDGD